MFRGTCLNSQTSTNDFVSALRSQIRWLSFGNEANLFERYHPLRPIMTWWNNRRMVRYVSKQLDDRLRSNVAKKDSAEIGGRKTIIDLALSNYLTEKEESSKQIPSSHGMDATFHDIAISQIRIFAFAGHDTTSSTMCYAFHLLSKNPSIRQSLIAEHNDVFGQEYNQTASLICGNPHLLNQLPYTLAVIKETLRLYPPASSTRRGEENYFINGLDGRHLPTNEFLIWINAYSIHHDPTYWPEPDEFIPERWLVPERHRLYPLKGAYRPFEFGPRNCIGQELAMLELKVVLVMTVREFDIVTVYEEWDQLHPRKDPKHLNGNRAYQVLNGSAHPSDGLPCRVSLSMKGDKDANVDTK